MFRWLYWSIERFGSFAGKCLLVLGVLFLVCRSVRSCSSTQLYNETAWGVPWGFPPQMLLPSTFGSIWILGFGSSVLTLSFGDCQWFLFFHIILPFSSDNLALVLWWWQKGLVVLVKLILFDCGAGFFFFFFLLDDFVPL